MRELIKPEQKVTIVPNNLEQTNKGNVLDVDSDGFRMQLMYKPDGFKENHICEFYSLTENGYLYFESYIKSITDNILTIANPIKHRFLQRRKFTRIRFNQDIHLTCNELSYNARTLDLSAGGMKLQTEENIGIENLYNVEIKLSDELCVKCKYQMIRIERGDNGLYTISGKFLNISNIDRMTLVQFCMKKEMENKNK